MEAGKLIQLIIEARERVRDVGAGFLYKPYTATMMENLACSVEISLDGINRELSSVLGIELYVDTNVYVTEELVSGCLKVKKVGEPVERLTITTENNELNEFLEEDKWVELRGVDLKSKKVKR